MGNDTCTQPIAAKDEYKNPTTDAYRIDSAFRLLPLVYNEQPAGRPAQVNELFGSKSKPPTWMLSVTQSSSSSVTLNHVYDYVSYLLHDIPSSSSSHPTLHHPYLEQYGIHGMILNDHITFIKNVDIITGLTFDILWKRTNNDSDEKHSINYRIETTAENKATLTVAGSSWPLIVAPARTGFQHKYIQIPAPKLIPKLDPQ